MAKGVKLEMNVSSVMNRLGAKIKQSLPTIASRVREDCNRYVRVDKGDLRSSSYLASDLKHGKIVWNTPYAKRVYYTGHPSTDINAEASLRWCEVAKEKHAEKWAELAQREITS